MPSIERRRSPCGLANVSVFSVAECLHLYEKDAKESACLFNLIALSNFVI